MEITYHFHNLENSEAIKEYLKTKLEKLTSHFTTLMSATARFKVEKIDHIVELTVNGDGVQFVGEEKATDMYAAIDLLEKKLEKQIKKHKEKNLGKHNRS